MAVDLTKKTGAELDQIIANHERLKRTSDPMYLDAVRLRRAGKIRTLDVKRTCDAIIGAAKEGNCLSYKMVADASGCEWNSAYPVIAAHLTRVLEHAFQNGWPPLTATVVNAENLETGEMKPETLAGFMSSVARIGYPVGTQPDLELGKMQRAVFRWAKDFKGA